MSEIKKGTWVQAGIMRGRVVSVHDNGAVPDVPDVVTGSKDAPAARVRIYRRKQDGAYIATNEYKGKLNTELKPIDPLPTPGVMRSLMNIYRTLTHNADETVNRALSQWQLRDAVSALLLDEGYYISDLFMDGAETFAIGYEIPERAAGSEYTYRSPNTTELYQFPVTNDGADVMIGDPIRVKHEFTPVPDTDDMGEMMQRGFMIYRDAKGVTRWAAIASTATINRQFQIDSKKLYDSMIKRATPGNMPYLTFYHKGKALKVGEVLAVARHGAVYVAGGTFDSGEFPEAVARAIEADPKYWGLSIAFKPKQLPRIERIGEFRIPIYEDGENTEISVLPDNSACNPFTNIEVERTMADDLKAAMERVFPENPTLQEKYIKLATATDDALTRAGAVTRATETAELAATPADQAAVTPATTPDEPIKYELTPEALQAVGAAFLASPQFKAITDDVARAHSELANANKLIASQGEVIRAMATQIAELQATDGAKQRQWLADAPKPRAIIGLPPTMTRAAMPVPKDDTSGKPEPEKVPEVPGHTFNNF